MARFVTFALQAFTAVVLARYLSARDYGVVGYATIFVSFLSQFNDLGIGTALIQREELDDRRINVAFTLRVVLGVLAFALGIAISPIAGLGFGDRAVSTVLIVLSLDFLISSVGLVSSSLLVRNLDFGRWIQPGLGAALVRSAGACWLAAHGWGFWSIVAGNLAASITQAVWFLCLGGHSIRFQWDKAIVGEFLKFGVPLFSSGLLIFAIFNADNFVIGSVAGAVALGYYAIAFNWASMPSGLVFEVVHTVLFPSLARMQSDRERLRRAYLRIMEQLTAAGFLVHVGLLCCAREFLIVVLGHGSEKWVPATRALQILCIYGLIRLLLEPLGNVLIALGKTSLLLRAAFVAAVIELAGLYPALRWGGINAVAGVVTLSYAVQWLVYWPLIRDNLDIRIADLARVLVPSVIAGLCAWTAAFLLQSAIRTGPASLLLLIIVVFTVFVIVQGFLSSWRWCEEWRQAYLAHTRQA